MGLFDDIPDDPEVAFLKLERSFREECDRAIAAGEYESDPSGDRFRYANRVLAARTALGLPKILADWGTLDSGDFTIDVYRNFIGDVEHCRTILEIQHSRRDKGLTIRFDTTAKSKLRHHLTQIRDFVGKLEIDDWKRGDLLKAINALEQEIDRDRSRLGVAGDFFVKFAGILGESAEKAEPARKWVDSIARLIWGAQMQERSNALPTPSEKRQIPVPPKQITAPKRHPASRQAASSDDEIPF